MEEMLTCQGRCRPESLRKKEDAGWIGKKS